MNIYQFYLSKQYDIIQSNLQKLFDNNTVVDDALHDFRVALRRFLTIFNIIFKLSNPDENIAQALLFIKSVRRESNHLRDLEVLKDNIYIHNSPLNEFDLFKSEIINYLDKIFSKEFSNFINIINTDEFQHSLNNLLSFSHNSSVDIDFLLIYSKRIKKITKTFNTVPLDDKTIHKIRIELKKIRYISEMLSLFDEDITNRLKAVQELLGKYNDLKNNIEILNSFINKKSGSRTLWYAIGYYHHLFLSSKSDLYPKIIKKLPKSIKLFSHIAS